jgi:predicted nucleotidyltransferase component of viral defense system
MSKAQAISDKLLAVSRRTRYSHQMLLIRFFHERLLYRLSISSYRNKLLLKGGNMLYFWQGEDTRPTVDIDFAGSNLSNQVDEISRIFRNILSLPVEDEVTFEIESLIVFEILEEKQYGGLRVKVPVMLGKIKQNLQIDIGYGDVITPDPMAISFPTILRQFENPQLLAYTIETVIAEKLQAMIVLAQLNSRMKDFYDVYTLLQHQSVDKQILRQAIEQTFLNRQTPLSFDSIVFTEAFYLDKNRVNMWQMYLKKIKMPSIEFTTVIQVIKHAVDDLFEN